MTYFYTALPATKPLALEYFIDSTYGPVVYSYHQSVVDPNTFWIMRHDPTKTSTPVAADNYYVSYSTLSSGISVTSVNF